MTLCQIVEIYCVRPPEDGHQRRSLVIPGDLRKKSNYWGLQVCGLTSLPSCDGTSREYVLGVLRARQGRHDTFASANQLHESWTTA